MLNHSGSVPQVPTILKISFLILLFAIQVQADAPISYNKELASDVELRGTFFTNDNADGFYVSLIGDNSIQIDSDIHYIDKTIKIKKTALDSRFKKFNEINMGITHISDDGIVNNYISPVVVDREFVYITVDFSTVIINGMIGTTTTTLTGLSGNQSISVPDGSSYDFNITNNQASVWTINGTDFTKRILWTLNTTSENLTNFQVGRIAPYDSDMQADMDDRQLTYYENYTLISFWDENVINSINATGYVKVPKTSTTEQQQFWMYYGNSSVSSSSNIHDVMEIGSDTFESLSSTYWLTESGTPSIVSNELILDPGDWVTGKGNIPNKVIMEYRLRYSASASYISAIGAVNVHYSPPDWEAQTADAFRYQYWSGHNVNTNVRNDGTRLYVSPSYTADTNYHVYKIVQESTNSIKFYYDDILKETMTTNVPNEDLFVTLDRSELSGAGTVYIDWCKIKKYTPIEPTWLSDGEEQTASGTINITASITGDNNTQSYNTSQSREFTLTPTGETNNVLVNTTSTNYDVTIITYWTENTTLIEEIVASGYVKQYINYTPSSNITSADLNTTIVNNLTSYDYLGTTTSTLNGVSKTTNRDGQEVNASVGSLTEDVLYLWNVTITYNNVPTVGTITNQTAYLGIAKSFTAPSFTDPEGLPIDTHYWQFGDGNTSSVQNPTHTYTSIDIFSANYTVTETATVSPQAVLRKFTMDVEVQPPQNVTTVLHQTNVSINWDDYAYADKYSVYELEDGFPYVDTNPTVDGVKDAIYDYAHEFLIFSPNPINLGDYETSYPVRTALGAYFFHEAVDNDDKLGDDDLIYYWDLDNNGLTVDDPAWKITDNVVKKYLWDGDSWQVTGNTNAIGDSTGGGTHYPKHELFIPIAELGANWTNGSIVKVLVKREDSSLSPDVVTWYPYGNINDTDTSLWQEMVLNDPESYILLDNTTNLWYNATGLTPFTIYHGAVSAWNGSVESNYTLFDAITEDIPTYTVSGTVSDSDGDPIAGATVYSCNGFVHEITTTNVSGYWIGYAFREDYYTICASKAGYYDNSIDIFVDSNLTNQNITLSTVPVIVSKYHKIGEMFFAIPTILTLVFQKIADVIPIIVVLVFIMLIINVIGVAIHAIRVWR